MADEVERVDTVIVTPFLRNLVSHATGGALDLEEHPDATLNSICVAISQHRNRIWKDAEQRGFKLCQDAMDREAIARIIDPHAWERRDEFAALLRGEGLSSDTSLAEMQKRSAARRVDKVVADSIAKADAIRTLSIKETGNG